MKKLTLIAFAAVPSTTGTAAFADQTTSPTQALGQDAPIAMTDAQMDQVAAGALIRIDVNNVLNRNEVDVRVPVDIRDVNVGVAAAVAVLGAAGAAVGQR